MKLETINTSYLSKKNAAVFIFVFAISMLTACKSTNSCASVEKQEINASQNRVTISTNVA